MTPKRSDVQASLDECQRALQASQARFASVMAHAAPGVVVVDAAGAVVYANLAAERLLDGEAYTLIGRSLPFPLEPGEHEAELAPPGSQRVQVSVHVTAIEWDGAPARMLSLYDVTRWRRAEAHAAALAGLGLRLAEARTREEAAAVALEVADRLLGWDSCWLDVYGPEPDSVITVMQIDVVDGERRPVAGTGLSAPSAIFHQVVESGALLIDRAREPEGGAHLRPIGDTARRSACLLFVPMRHHGAVNGVVSVQSYTPGAYTQEDLETLQALADHCAGAFERLHSEAARRESEERFRALIENSSDAIAVLDPDGVVLYASPATTAITGYRPDELIGERVLDRLGARTAATLREQFARLADEPGSRADGTVRVRHKDGGVRWVEGVLTSLLHEPGVRGIVANYRDVTARHAAEAVLRRRNQELLALNRIGQALAQLAEPAETSRLVHHWLGLVLDNSSFYVALYDAERQYIDFPFYTIQGQLRPPGGRPAANGITEYVLRTREPLLVGRDMHAALAKRGIEPVGQPARSMLAVPMLLGSEAMGVLALQDYRHENAYDDHARDLLMTVAAQAAAAFANARLYAAVQQELDERRRAEAALRESEARLRSVLAQAQAHAEQLAAINALGRALAETFELPQIYEHLYQATRQLLPNLATVILALYDEEQACLAPVFGVHGGVPIDVTQLPPAALEAPGQGTQSEALHTRQPFIINDLAAWHQQRGKGLRLGSGPDTLSGLYVPLLAKGRVVGVLQAQANERGRFTEADAALLSLAANTAAIAIENARLFAETERRLHYMQALHDIHRAITSSLDLRVTLNVLLDQATAQLGVDAAAVLLFNPHMQSLDYAAGRGFRTKAIERSHLRLGEGIAGRAALERRTLSVPNLAEAAPPLARTHLLAAEGFRAYWTVPLIAKGEIKGVLDVFHRGRLQPTAEWLDFLQTVASQAALAIDNTSLFNRLQRSNVELTLAYEATIEGWSRALDLRDPGARGRSQRMTRLTERLARRLGLAEHDMVHVRRGALLHDIGTMGIPESILLKPGPLTADEWAIMRQHPTLAYELLSPIAYLRPALDIPYCHHEKWDGTGYPRGLRGEQIPLAARAFAVVDMWDALSSDRPFRPAWPAAQVLAHLREQAGQHFDPRCVEAFVNLMESEHGPPPDG